MTESPDKILIVVEQLRRRVPGGSGTYASGLLQGLISLARKGSPVPPITLFASKHRGMDPQRLGPPVDPLVGFGMPLITSRLPGPLATRARDRSVLHAPKEFSVVHGTTLAIPSSKRARMFVTLHDLGWRQLPFAYTARGIKWHEEAFTRSIAEHRSFIVSSDEVAAELREAGGKDMSVTVISPGSNHLAPPEFPTADRTLERLGVSGPFILSVGTLEPRKNLVTLMDAYSKVRDTLPEAMPLVVVGPEGWGPGVTPTEGVMLAGPVSDGELSALYARALLLAYVPLLEGFGLPPLEAMRAGLPVVASPMPSLGGAAFEVDPGNADQIAEGLVAVATDDALRHKLVEAGRARAAKLTWEACAEKHLALWQPSSGS